MKRYQVIVGNLGTVLETNSKVFAWRAYGEYIGISQSEGMRATGEDVTLMCDDEIIAEYAAPKDDSDQ